MIITCRFSELSGINPTMEFQDTTLEKQQIYNGRIWRDLYARVDGDQYFLSGEFLFGDVSFNGREFNDLRFRYDIYNDEIILLVNLRTIIVLNKEMVSEFTLRYRNRSYRFLNMGSDSTSLLWGYANLLYDGPTTLFVKYSKKIELMAVDNKYDRFYQQHRIYVRKDGMIFPVSGRIDLYKLLADKKAEIRDFVKKNNQKILRNNPESFVRILQYYDDLNR